MSGLVSASSPPTPNFASFQPKSQSARHCHPSRLIIPRNQPCFSDIDLGSPNFGRLRFPQRFMVLCNSSTRPGPPGENESRNVLDAFFLGKALAEAINERVESTVGEFLGVIGRLQAEQQKQVQDFQEEVLERAKKAKEKAAREAMEAQGLVPKSTASVNATTITNGVVVTPASSASSSDPTISPPERDQSPGDEDAVSEVSGDD